MQLPPGRYSRGDTPTGAEGDDSKPRTGSAGRHNGSYGAGRSTPSQLAPLQDSVQAYERKIQQKDQTIAGLREQNRKLEATLQQQHLETQDAKTEARRLWKKNKEKNYIQSQLKHEIDERISRDEKIKSLKNVLEWENVGKRHEVEKSLNSKIMQLDETTNSLQSAEERLRSLESKNRILAGKLSKERTAREEAEQSFTALKAEAEQKMAASFEESERTTTMYQAQNSQLQNVLKAVTEDLKREKDSGALMYKKLGNVNVMLVLQRTVGLKRAEMVEMLHDQLHQANEKLVERGGTAISTKWMEGAIHKGFTHKLQKMAEDRQSNFETKEILDTRQSAYDEQVARMEEAQHQIVALKEELTVETERLRAEHGEAMLLAKDEEEAKVAEKQAYIDRMVSDQQEVVNVAVQQLKTEYDAKILTLEGERDDLKTITDKLQTDIREWQEKFDAAQSYRAQLQKSHETEAKGLNEQIDHLEDLCQKAQAAQDEAEGAAQLAEADRKAAEAMAEDAKLHSITLSTDLERLRAKLQALDAKEQERINALNRSDFQNEADPAKQNLRLKEKIGGLELTVRSQMEDLNRTREASRRQEEELKLCREDLLGLKEKVGMKDDLLRDRERKIEQMRDALKSKFEKMHEAVLQKDKDAEDMVREVSARQKEIAFAKVAHEKTRQELASMSALHDQHLKESCQGIVEAMIQRACVEGEYHIYQAEKENEIATLQQNREADLEAWRSKAQHHAAMSKTREEELSKQLQTTLFEAGQAQSRAKNLDEALGEAQRRAQDLKKEEEDLTKWKADLFQKVDQLRSENEELESGLRLSAEEIERLQKRIMYLDARRDELKEQAAALAGENETLRADKRVAALESELDGVRQELAAVAQEAMSKEEEMKEMKKKFAQVMDKMGGLQMGTTEVTAGQIGDGVADTSAQAIATPQLPPMGKKPAGIGQHARQFDMPNAEEIHKYAIHLGIDPVEDKEFLWLAEEALCAPLPPHWTEHLDPDKGVYYFNANTGESAWGESLPRNSMSCAFSSCVYLVTHPNACSACRL